MKVVDIGYYFNKDHSSVPTSVVNIENMIDVNSDMQEQIDAIKFAILNNKQ